MLRVPSIMYDIDYTLEAMEDLKRFKKIRAAANCRPNR